MQISYHGNNDWCHLCGDRHYSTVDVRYPDNAEHEKANKKYIRICSACIQQMLHIVSRESDSEWRVGFSGELKAAEDHLRKAISICNDAIPARHMDKLLKAQRNIHVVSFSA